MSHRIRPSALVLASFAAALLVCVSAGAQAQGAPFTTAYRYNLAGQITGIIRPDPDAGGPLYFPAVRNTYDTAGRLVTVELGELLSWQSETITPASWTGFTVFQTRQMTYDPLGRRISEQTIAGGVAHAYTQMSYDAFGRVECVAQRMNPSAFSSLPSSACVLGPVGSHGPDRITRTTYDVRGLPLTVERAYGTSDQQTYATYTHSPNGNLLTVRDAKGNVSSMTYDGHDRLERWSFPSPTVPGQVSSSDYEEYTYDPNGNVLLERRRNQQTIGYNYDALNRMRLKDMPGAGEDVYYDYDLRGLQLYARFGSESGPGITTTYDGFGRVVVSSSNTGGVTRNVGSAYDSNGNRTRVTHPDGAFFEYAYDGLDRVMHISENGPSETLVSIFYDAQGRRSALERGDLATSTAFGYDPVSRLASITHDLDGSGTGNDVTLTFDYNAAHQIVERSVSNSAYEFPYAGLPTRTYATNGLNQYTQISGGTAVTPTWDANGNLTFDGATTFAYDAENRLRSASGAKNATLMYDPFGRLQQIETTRFVYDGGQLIAEYNGTGTLLRRYVYGPGIDEPMVWYEGSSVSGAGRRYLHADHQGSIVALAGSSGTAIHAYRYDPYGVADAYAVAGGANSSRFQYTGQAALSEVGLNYYKARLYNPALGRFMQTDPIGHAAGLNRYAYVGNDPLNNVDPSGLRNCPLEDIDCIETPESAARPGDPPEPSDAVEEMQEVVVSAQKIRKDSAGKPIRFNDGKEHSFIVDNDSMTATNLKTVKEVDCGDVVVQVNEVNAPKGSTISHTHPTSFGPPGQVPGPRDGGAARASSANAAFVMTSAHVFTIEAFGNGTFRTTVSGAPLTDTQRAALVESMQSWESPNSTGLSKKDLCEKAK